MRTSHTLWLLSAKLSTKLPCQRFEISVGKHLGIIVFLDDSCLGSRKVLRLMYSLNQGGLSKEQCIAGDGPRQTCFHLSPHY